ncbi:MAG: hypothetical protein IK096_01380 [Lachnospiraceae bacterium]|nr:hypothetical protein [Lachnospiraceae bacterium]
MFFSITATAQASDSQRFISQNAALSTSSIRGILNDISAEVRGPASSYTLTIDSASGDELKPLLTEASVRYNLMECYDLSLTAVNSQEIIRNPQFGDVTITIPISSSMDPAHGTYAIYTLDPNDGQLERIPCSVIYGQSTTYAVKFITIHFSPYAIVYTSGGSTRVTGKRSTASMPGLSNATNATITSGTDDNTGNTNAGTGVSDTSGSTAGIGASATDGSSITPSANGKDENGNPPTYHPRTGDRRYYAAIISAIIAAGILFLAIFFTRRREA